METNATTLKQLIVEKNTTQEAVALALGMNRSTLYRKMKGGIKSLTIGEAKQISKFLNLSESEATAVFWGQ
ncbi:MAG: helix-turn-helix transcriptional regulator [Clostridia bacterium]|nr:helix-turn-helix transcriptional regulator [Clostridia bacterium]